MKFNLTKISCYIALSLTLCGCKKDPESGDKHIIFKTHQNINNKLALKIFIVKAYSEEAWNAIKNIDTTSFFSIKNQLLIEFAQNQALEIYEENLLNNDKEKCYILPSNNKGYWGVVIFIKYLDNTENKIILQSKQKTTIIIFSNNKFLIVKTNKKTAKQKNNKKNCKILKQNKE